jgi:hypothetical protein
MNKMHIMARIVFAALAIYLMIGLIPYVIGSVALFFQTGGIFSRIWWSVASVVVVLLFAAAVYYGLIHKRDALARYAVGNGGIAEPQTPVQWLPVAFRLICVVAGMIFLYRFVTRIHISLQALVYLTKADQPLGANWRWRQIWESVILLPFAVYLLCGAPHFVRWHVRKTLELCAGSGDNAGESEI